MNSKDDVIVALERRINAATHEAAKELERLGVKDKRLYSGVVIFNDHSSPGSQIETEDPVSEAMEREIEAAAQEAGKELERLGVSDRRTYRWEVTFNDPSSGGLPWSQLERCDEQTEDA